MHAECAAIGRFTAPSYSVFLVLLCAHFPLCRRPSPENLYKRHDCASSEKSDANLFEVPVARLTVQPIRSLENDFTAEAGSPVF